MEIESETWNMEEMEQVQRRRGMKLELGRVGSKFKVEGRSKFKVESGR